MWRSSKLIFGGDYIHLRNSATQIVRRVRYTDQGERYVVYYGANFVFIDRPDTGWTITPLTEIQPILADH